MKDKSNKREKQVIWLLKSLLECKNYMFQENLESSEANLVLDESLDTQMRGNNMPESHTGESEEEKTKKFFFSKQADRIFHTNQKESRSSD